MSSTFAFQPLVENDLLSLASLSKQEMAMLFETAADFKRKPQDYRGALAGKTIVLLFEKDSLRTLVSFEVGMAKLGGAAVYLDHRTNRIGEREPIRDYAKNLERWTEAIVARTYDHATIEELALHARIPVINALSNLYHPCQALADYFTLREHFGGLDGLRIAYVGDGNNVCHSLINGAAKLGVSITIISPKGYQPSDDIVRQAQRIAKQSGGRITVTDELSAVADHHAVYTDTWASMGQESEAKKRRQVFIPFQVTQGLMDLAGADAVFMHCLPAHRGEEVAAEVIDSDRSIVYEQAENRMHAQNAVLLHLLGPRGKTAPSASKKRSAAVASQVTI